MNPVSSLSFCCVTPKSFLFVRWWTLWFFYTLEHKNNHKQVGLTLFFCLQQTNNNNKQTKTFYRIVYFLYECLNSYIHLKDIKTSDLFSGSHLDKSLFDQKFPEKIAAISQSEGWMRTSEALLPPSSWLRDNRRCRRNRCQQEAQILQKTELLQPIKQKLCRHDSALGVGKHPGWD